MTKNQKDSTIQYYETHSAELSKRYETAEVDLLHQRLLDTFPKGSHLLEVGCGSGREAAFLMERGYSVNCIEASGTMISRAIELHPELKGLIITCRIPEECPVAGKTYDGIYAIASIMHLEKQEVLSALELFYSLLVKGGKLLFSVPLSRPDLKESGYDSKGRYFLLLSEKEWINIIQNTGFYHIITSTNPDGMGRKEITWLNCIAEK